MRREGEDVFGGMGMMVGATFNKREKSRNGKAIAGAALVFPALKAGKLVSDAGQEGLKRISPHLRNGFDKLRGGVGGGANKSKEVVIKEANEEVAGEVSSNVISKRGMEDKKISVTGATPEPVVKKTEVVAKPEKPKKFKKKV
mgnify:CR=1 FL=1